MPFPSAAGGCPFTDAQRLFADLAATRAADGLPSSAVFGARVVSRYDEIVAARHDPDTFSSTPTVPEMPSPWRELFAGRVPSRGTLLGLDNPDHDRLRSAVNTFFMPRRSARYEPWITATGWSSTASGPTCPNTTPASTPADRKNCSPGWRLRPGGPAARSNWSSSGSPPTRPATPRTAPSRCSRTNRLVTVAVDETVLDAVGRAGRAVLSACREGTCGTCEVAVVDGVPEHRDSVLSLEERLANRTMMTCASRCRGSRLVLDL